MKFKSKPKEIQATQWFKNGDHPKDNSIVIAEGDSDHPSLSEGKIVRYFRRPDCDGHKECEKCKQAFHWHGWIDTLEGGHIVCPGDWIITGIKGENYPCKPDIFELSYEAVI